LNGVEAVRVGYETRGYPIRILLWHEVVNDTVAGTPVAVTYCPMTNSGLVFDRRIADRVLSFAATDRQYAGSLVIYDRQTESLWPQLAERAALGVLTGTTLELRHAGIVSWRDFRRTYEDAWVLSGEAGPHPPYGRNPYPRYNDPHGPPPRGVRVTDSRLVPMTRVVGVPGLSVTFVRSVLASGALQTLNLGDVHLVAWHRPGQASALDADGRDIGTVALFDAEIDGRVLHTPVRRSRCEGRVDRPGGGCATTGMGAGRGVPGPAESCADVRRAARRVPQFRDRPAGRRPGDRDGARSAQGGVEQPGFPASGGAVSGRCGDSSVHRHRRGHPDRR
jgi:hypothetical protein